MYLQKDPEFFAEGKTKETWFLESDNVGFSLSFGGSAER
jgi:hypothetical protein